MKSPRIQPQNDGRIKKHIWNETKNVHFKELLNVTTHYKGMRNCQYIKVLKILTIKIVGEQKKDVVVIILSKA